MDIFEPSIAVPKGICVIQLTENVVQHSEPQEALVPTVDFKESRKAPYVQSYIVRDQMFSLLRLFRHFLLIPLLRMNDITSISGLKKNYKAVNINQEVLCFPINLWHELYAVHLCRIL